MRMRHFWAIFGPKVAHPHNFGLALRIVLQFRTMEEAKGDMEIILIFFSKKNLIQGNLLVFAPNWYVLITLGLLSGFLINFAT